jgi:excisionase family DNA binding protein
MMQESVNFSLLYTSQMDDEADCLFPDNDGFLRGYPQESRVQTQCVSIAEAAKALGVSKSHAYRIIAEGALRSIKIGHRHLVPVVSIESFISNSLSATGARMEQTAPE